MTNLQKYKGLIRFIAPDNKHDKSYHKPTELVNWLNAKAGDFWRFLIPKSDLQGVFLGRCKLVLARPEWITYNATSFKNEITFPLNNLVVGNTTDRYITEIGQIRKQECENYCEFKLIVNSFPTGNTINQFVLQRSTGQGVFGTFSTLQSNPFYFMEELKKHFEKNGDVSCLCEVSGNVLTVRAYINDRFFLNDQQCKIAIGRVDAENENNPQLDARFISTITIPAKDCYDLNVKNIAVGNILTLGDVKITVVAGDTNESIKKRFLGEESCYFINQSEKVNYGFDKGSYLEINQSKPSVVAVYQNTSSGIDTYKIKITGDILEGNTIQLSCNGKNPITKTVGSSDTELTLTALFNPDAGQTYKVTNGNVPNVSVFEGSKIVKNTNDLTFALTNKTAIPEKVVDRHKCYISDDVHLRNEYKLMNKVYIAKKGDTALIVAQALGQKKQQFIYEVPTGTAFTAYAQKGKLYGDENILDLRILSQPKVRKANQYVCEVKFPKSFPSRLIDCDLYKGEWQLAVYDTIDNAVVSLGNFIDFSKRIQETKLVEFAGTGTYFGYEYLENKLSQIIRMPIMLKQVKHETEENMINLINGGYGRNETNIMQYQEFVSKGVESSAMQAMQVILRHENIIIEGVEYQSKGEISDNYVDDFTGIGQIAGKLYLQGKISNNDSLWASGVQLGYGTVTVEGEYIGRRVLCRTIDAHYEVNKMARLKAAEYDILIDNPQHEIGCIVYVNDIEIKRLTIVEKARTRIRPIIRLNSDGFIRIVFVGMEHMVDITQFVNEDDVQGFTAEIYGSESINENPPNLTGGAYTEAYDLSYES